MSLCEVAEFSVVGVRETPMSQSTRFSAKPSFVTPGQQQLMERNLTMRQSVIEAVAEAEARDAHVALSALANAQRFLQLLPSNMPATDAYVSRNGSICFDWDDDSRCQISILLQDSERIAFAGYFSGDRVNGAANFSVNELPEELLAAANKWARHRARQPSSSS